MASQPMSFDHCGMHDIICERCGVKIPILSYEQCVSDLAKNIDYLLEHPEKFEQLAYGVLECAKNILGMIENSFYRNVMIKL